MPRPLRIFISYRRIHNGAPCAYILSDRLTALGIEVFYDNKTLHDYNSNYKNEIRREIDSSDYVLVLLQPGCMEEKNKDVYLFEIRYAIEKMGLERVLMLPLDEIFRWENENIPQDIEHIQDHNNLAPLRLSNVDATIQNILKRCKCRPELSHYVMLQKQRQMAMVSGCRSVVQKTGDIYSIDLRQRWNFAKRISLLSIGLGSLTGRMAPMVAEKYAEGVSFRLMSVDPTGESARDTIDTKINSFMPEYESEYLQHCQKKASLLFSRIAEKCKDLDNEVEYRVTNHHLTCTIQIVEHENPALDYVYVEYIAICATGQDQEENRAMVICRNDPNYDYYYRQFEKVWKTARPVYKKDMGDVQQ